MLTRQTPFQYNRRVFVRIPFRANGKNFKKNEEFPWEVMRLDHHRVSHLYSQGFLIHDEQLEEETQGIIGDGLQDLTLEQLHKIVKDTNEKVDHKFTSKTERERKKMKLSNSHSKQVGLIRQWRHIYQRELAERE